MSDTVIGSSVGDRKRTLTSICIALAAHAIAILLVSILAGFGVPQPPLPVAIELQLGSAPMEAPGPAGGGEPAPASGGPKAAAAPGAAPKAASAGAATIPAAPRRAAAAGAVSASAKAGAGGDFVIPVPRGSAAQPAPVKVGPSFQATGGKTGVAESLPIAPNPMPQPDAAVGPSGRGGSPAASPAGSPQRSGQGVAPQGQSGTGSGGSLDLNKLDKSLAAGAGGAGGAGGTGLVRAGSGASAAGGTGGSGSGGSGGGTGTGTGTGAGAGAGGGGDYRVAWNQPDASRGRKLEISVKPRIPAWVSDQGLTLTVRAAFTVMPNGLIGAAAIERSSGYADVDSEVIAAIRLCRFTATDSKILVKGVITYVVNPH